MGFNWFVWTLVGLLVIAGLIARYYDVASYVRCAVEVDDDKADTTPDLPTR